MASSICSFIPVLKPEFRYNWFRRFWPSGVGSMDTEIPYSRLAASAVRRATIKSSRRITGRPVVSPTTFPASSTLQPSPGPPIRMSPVSGLTITYSIRWIPAMYRISSVNGVPSLAAACNAASMAFMEIARKPVDCLAPSATASRLSMTRCRLSRCMASVT